MKNILTFLAILFLFPSAFAAEATVLDIVNSSTIPTNVYAGDLITLNFDVKNTNINLPVYDVMVSAQLNDNYFQPLKVSESVGSIDPQSSKTVSFRFTAKKTALPGSYTVPIMISYQSQSSTVTYSKGVDFDLSVCHQLRVENISLSNTTPHIGDMMTVSATIQNACSTAARNVSVELDPVTTSSIAPFIVSSGTIDRIGAIEPNSSSQVSFALGISDKVSAQAYVFSLDANCDECSKVFTNNFSFLVLGKPNLVFSSIDYSVDGAPTGQDKRITQGNDFTLSIQLDNIGEEKAKAVEVDANFGEGIAGTSKSFLGNIKPDDSGAAVFNLSAAYDSKPGKHPGTITVSYLDELGNSQKFTQQYSIYVNQQAPTSPLVYAIILMLVLAILGLIYLMVKFVFRQLALRKSQ